MVSPLSQLVRSAPTESRHLELYFDRNPGSRSKRWHWRFDHFDIKSRAPPPATSPAPGSAPSRRHLTATVWFYNERLTMLEYDLQGSAGRQGWNIFTF